jgi:hypothetical protein
LPVPVHLIKAYFPSTSQIIYFVWVYLFVCFCRLVSFTFTTTAYSYKTLLPKTRNTSKAKTQSPSQRNTYLSIQGRGKRWQSNGPHSATSHKIVSYFILPSCIDFLQHSASLENCTFAICIVMTSLFPFHLFVGCLTPLSVTRTMQRRVIGW